VGADAFRSGANLEDILLGSEGEVSVGEGEGNGGHGRDASAIHDALSGAHRRQRIAQLEQLVHDFRHGLVAFDRELHDNINEPDESLC